MKQKKISRTYQSVQRFWVDLEAQRTFDIGRGHSRLQRKRTVPVDGALRRLYDISGSKDSSSWPPYSPTIQTHLAWPLHGCEILPPLPDTKEYLERTLTFCDLCVIQVVFLGRVFLTPPLGLLAWKLNRKTVP